MSQIVVNIEDPSDSNQPALEALTAYRQDGDAVCLFHNIYHHRIVDQSGQPDQVLSEARELLLGKRESQMQQLADRLDGSADIRIVWAREGWQALIALAREGSAELVITQTRAQTRWRRLVLGNDDWELVRHCPMPLLLVREASSKNYRHVVAAIDPLHEDDKPADLDRAILALALKFATRYDGSIDVLNCVPPLVSVSAGPQPSLLAAELSAQNDAVQQHKIRVHELVDQLGTPVRCETVDLGVAAENIVAHVIEKGSDLLVLGAVARSALQRMLVGSTTEQVLDRVPCDVLLAKPTRFDPRLPSLASLLGSTV